MEGQSDELMLELERVVPTGRERTFAAFTDPDELGQWWGPEGFAVRSLDFEPRVGETYRIEMQPPEGDAFHLTGEFREVDPPARLAYTFVWEPADPDDVETLVVLHLPITANQRRLPSRRARSRPRSAARFTGTGGRRASTSSSATSPRARSGP